MHNLTIKEEEHAQKITLYNILYIYNVYNTKFRTSSLPPTHEKILNPPLSTDLVSRRVYPPSAYAIGTSHLPPTPLPSSYI